MRSASLCTKYLFTTIGDKRKKKITTNSYLSKVIPVVNANRLQTSFAVPQYKCTKLQFIHLLTAAFKDLYIKNSKKRKKLILPASH